MSVVFFLREWDIRYGSDRTPWTRYRRANERRTSDCIQRESSGVRRVSGRDGRLGATALGGTGDHASHRRRPDAGDIECWRDVSTHDVSGSRSGRLRGPRTGRLRITDLLHRLVIGTTSYQHTYSMLLYQNAARMRGDPIAIGRQRPEPTNGEPRFPRRFPVEFGRIPVARGYRSRPYRRLRPPPVRR